MYYLKSFHTEIEFIIAGIANTKIDVFDKVSNLLGIFYIFNWF